MSKPSLLIDGQYHMIMRLNNHKLFFEPLINVNAFFLGSQCILIRASEVRSRYSSLQKEQNENNHKKNKRLLILTKK